MTCVSASACGPALAVSRENRQSAAIMVMTTTSAERLLKRVAGGDRVAFAELYDRYASAVYGACLRVLRETQAAEDAAQDAFASSAALRATRPIQAPAAPRFASNAPACRQIAANASWAASSAACVSRSTRRQAP